MVCPMKVYSKEVLFHQLYPRIENSMADARSKNCNALILASYLGHEEMVSSLLSGDYKIDQKCECQGTALHHASSSGIVKLLLDYGFDINLRRADGSTALHSAVLRDETQVVSALLKSKADVNAQLHHSGYTPLHLVRSTAVEEILLKHKAEINAKNNCGDTPLHWVQSAQVAELLLANGADINAANNFGETPLSTIDIRNGRALLAVLLNRGTNINAKDKWGTSIIHYALVDDDMEIIQLLLERGADVSLVDEFGRPPLHAATRPEIARMLLERGADINSRNRNGFTLLHSLATQVQPYGTHSSIEDSPLDYMSFLVEHGADLNAVDGFGRSALHCLVSASAARLLLANGAKVDAQDVRGRSALHSAVIYDDEHLVAVLLQYGADIGLKDSDGLVPPQYIQSAKFSNLVVSAGLIIASVSLRVADLPLSTKNLAQLASSLIICSDVWTPDQWPQKESNYRSLSQEETIKMKKHKLSGTFMLYNVLRTTSYEYFKDSIVARSLDEIDYSTYPIYGELIVNKIKNDKYRFDAEQNLVKIMRSIKDLPALPEELIVKIISHLSDTDLVHVGSKLALWD